MTIRSSLEEATGEQHLQQIAKRCHELIDRMLGSRYSHKMLMAAERGLTMISQYKANRAKSHIR